MTDSSYFCKKNIKHLIVIEGPTASGKTGLSIELAKRLNTCVISADSRQFYKELSIGTAKPTLDEQDGIPHFLIDSHAITEEVTAAKFEREALAILEREFTTKDTIILTGGSGMFIDALCIGLDPIPTSAELRTQITEEYEENGRKPLLEELEQKDPTYFNSVDQYNPMRIIRAIEVIRLTGKPFSEFRKANPTKRNFKVHRFVIDHPREQLYERINSRVDQMIANGLLEEVKSVIQFRDLSSLNTVGYKELFNYLDGNCDLESAIHYIKQNTRHYAKRQLTWFKRHPESVWINYSSTEEMATKILQHFTDNIH